MNQRTETVLILALKNEGENGRRVYLLTQDGELIDARAQGIRKAGSKLKSHLSPFRRARVQLIGSRRPIVGQVEILNNYEISESGIECLSAGVLVNEAVIYLLLKSEPEPSIFTDLPKLWEKMSSQSDRKLLVGYQLFRLSQTAGFGPVTDSCPDCHGAYPKTGLYLSLPSGGIVCNRHPFGKNAWPVGADIVKLLRLTSEPLEKFCKVKVKTQLANQFCKLSLEWMEDITCRKLKSRRIWEEMNH